MPYRVHAVDLRRGDQFAPDLLRTSPNNKITAVVDGEQSVFESGAILVYLAEDRPPARRLGSGRWPALDWL